ncbi:hypothetical protein BDV41DRAFT_542388 [Aspergillus transmontanensis]|uniref:Uncharacterized protein n=1 Tax=Aspergillus transmontanensis TaxID=1034304 RepID=A0A5N6VRK0_9EURO|nr:hypothetical protein BDV41DRAFT_542388 [Aspergillus transmontanensis]
MRGKNHRHSESKDNEIRYRPQDPDTRLSCHCLSLEPFIHQQVFFVFAFGFIITGQRRIKWVKLIIFAKRLEQFGEGPHITGLSQGIS